MALLPRGAAVVVVVAAVLPLLLHGAQLARRRRLEGLHLGRDGLVSDGGQGGLVVCEEMMKQGVTSRQTFFN